MGQGAILTGQDLCADAYLSKIKQLEAVTHMIAHNLRGAGANIKMLSEVLQRKHLPDTEHPKDDDEFTEGEAIDYIQESSSSLLNTLNTLMEVADIQLAENVPYNNCDFREIVSDIILQLHGLMHLKHAEIEFNLEVANIHYPFAYLESILYNFINNALKYSRPDAPLRISVSTYMVDNRVVLSVKDNGLGIDLEKYGKRMFQLKQVFHKGYESKGIGLYITKTQVASLGGEIAVNSEVGLGSEFMVKF